MRLKKFVALAICGAMLSTGGFYNLSAKAAEPETVQENAQDTQEVGQEENVEVDEVVEPNDLVENDEAGASEELAEETELVESEVAEESEEFEEQTDIADLLSMRQVKEPMDAGFRFLETNDFFKCRSVKRIKGGRIYWVSKDGESLFTSVSYEYNSNGKLVKAVEKDERFDDIYTYTYEYYDNGDLKAENYHEKSKNRECKDKTEYHYYYNENGKCRRVESDSSTDATYFIADDASDFEYDEKGNIIKEKLDSKKTNYFDYDSKGNCIKKRIYNQDGNLEEVHEYNTEGFLTKITYYDENGNGKVGVTHEYEYTYDSNGDITGILDTCPVTDGPNGPDFPYIVRRYEFDYDYPLTTTGIYCASNYPSIQAGINIQKSNPSDVVEYKWVGCNNNNPKKWFEVSPWTKNNNWMNWTPKESGGYVFVCYARIVGQPETEIQYAFGTEYHKQIKGICQMPYTGEGGGYLIGIESYDNPNHKYQYEMLILDCNLYMQGKDAWVYTTGRCGADGNCLWTVWQPVYGYYWTLFRIYDSSTGELVDEACYGFENVN